MPRWLMETMNRTYPYLSRQRRTGWLNLWVPCLIFGVFMIIVSLFSVSGDFVSDGALWVFGIGLGLVALSGLLFTIWVRKVL